MDGSEDKASDSSNASFQAPQNQVDSRLVDLVGYVCEEKGDNKFLIRHKSEKDRTEHHVEMEVTGKNVQFIGLPDMITKQLMAFSSEELKQYPNTCLNVILKQTYQPKQDLKSSDEANMLISNAADIRQDNPSKYYKVVGKEGVGGFARVFRC